MEHKETGCQQPEGPILCINNCGFFGSTATMNMCSKCHKEMIMKQEQAKLAASSIDSIVNGGDSGKEPIIAGHAEVAVAQVEVKTLVAQPAEIAGPSEGVTVNPKGSEGPNRCSTCRKRVGLTGFNCRCGNLYCAMHRYSDKHDCQFDYRTAARDAIAKANPVVKAEKLDKI
ncbi:zinc finger A20 and AN1 domain-containing stress-associated protein 8 [Oryza glaberrima]|nr:zinc finger A20 and AN1 domain-containing stress-associated protein 8 [Oryza glaberrima]